MQDDRQQAGLLLQAAMHLACQAIIQLDCYAKGRFSKGQESDLYVVQLASNLDRVVEMLACLVARRQAANGLLAAASRRIRQTFNRLYKADPDDAAKQGLAFVVNYLLPTICTLVDKAPYTPEHGGYDLYQKASQQATVLLPWAKRRLQTDHLVSAQLLAALEKFLERVKEIAGIVVGSEVLANARCD
jgi:hypothetical protein